jgi:GNAT superfamily N-acetyltransferase
VLRAVHDADGYPVNWPDDPFQWLAQPSLIDAWVAEREGEVVGHIGLCRSAPGDLAPQEWSRQTGQPSEAAAVVSRLYVSPGARGHGIGALLLTQATRAAHHHGLHPVLDVLATDSAAAELYRRASWSMLAALEEEWSPSQKVTVHCYAAPTDFAESGPTINPSSAVAVVDNTGTVVSNVYTMQGASYSADLAAESGACTASPCYRWGDYTSLLIDPSNSAVVWAEDGAAPDPTDWTTRITRVTNG